MTYLATLRASRTVAITAIVLTILTALAVGFILRAEFQHPDKLHAVSPWPFSAMVAATGVIAVITATVLGSALDGISRAPALAFTRPEPRALGALRVYAVDFAAVLIIWAFAIALAAAGSALTRTLNVFLSPDLAAVIALFCGVSIMWYGLITLVAVFFPGRGGAIAGASWALAMIVPALAAAGFPQPLNAIFHALLYIDPMAYLQGHAGVQIGEGPKQSPIDLLFTAPPARAAAATLIGVAALALATRFWTTREVSA